MMRQSRLPHYFQSRAGRSPPWSTADRTPLGRGLSHIQGSLSHGPPSLGPTMAPANSEGGRRRGGRGREGDSEGEGGGGEEGVTGSMERRGEQSSSSVAAAQAGSTWTGSAGRVKAALQLTPDAATQFAKAENLKSVWCDVAG